jgi:hypothetical protein
MPRPTTGSAPPLRVAFAAFVAFVLAATPMIVAGCNEAEATNDTPETFPMEPHYLWPTVMPDEGQIAAGAFTGEALPQPIGFPHYTHVTTLNMDCQYCHFVARKSIHAGVPPTETCMGCHKYVKKDAPEITKLAALWASGEPTAWNKVHDLPDHVVFNHGRHVKAGVNCTECHGQMGLQGEPQPAPGTAEGEAPVMVVNAVNIRETTLQMGWCLQCHATHPSIDTNYGEKSDQRRAELKDCWTCHK